MRLVLVILSLIGNSINAQLETSNSLRLNTDSNLSINSSKISSGLTISKNPITLYQKPKDSMGYNRMSKPFDMTGDKGFYKPENKLTPKWFKKDKEIKEEYKSDQYLGDFKSKSNYVRLVYRDHESVDGDLVRIYINDDIVRNNVLLSASFEGFKIDLIKGFNRIDILALNQGASGPNTAEFHLYDDLGNLITANEWNLTTGVKASLIVIKD